MNREINVFFSNIYTRSFIGPYFSGRFELTMASEKFNVGRLILSSGTTKIKLITEFKNISISTRRRREILNEYLIQQSLMIEPPSGMESLITFRNSRMIDSTLLSKSSVEKSNTGSAP